MRRYFPYIASLLFVFFLGCSGRPNVPVLPKYGPHPIQRVVLSDQFNAKDAKEIFRALNSDGSLSGLKPWIEDVSDEKLEDILSLIDRYLLDAAETDSGLVAIARKHLEKKSFSDSLGWWERESKAAGFKDFAHLIWRVANRKDLSWFAKQDLDLVHPELAVLFRESRERAEKAYVKSSIEKFRTETPLSGDEILADLQKFFLEPEVKVRVLKPLEGLSSFSIGQTIFNGLNLLKEKNGSAAFEGLGLGIWNMSQSKPTPGTGKGMTNQLEQLFRFADYATRPAENLHERIQERFKAEPGLARGWAISLGNEISDTLSAVIRETLSEASYEKIFWMALATEEGETESFQRLTTAILDTLQRVLGPLREKEEANAATYNEMLEKNSARMAEKIRSVVKAASEKVSSMAEGEEYARKLWADPSIELEPQLISTARDCQGERPFIETETALSIFTLMLSRSGVMNFLQQENLMDGVNTYLPLEMEKVRTLKRLAFERFNIGRMAPSQRAEILRLFPPETHFPSRELAAGVLDTSDALYQLDEKVHKNLSSPFETYHAVVTYTSKQELPWISRLLRLAATEELYAVKDQTPKFPSLYKGIQSRRLSEGLFRLAQFEPSEQFRLMGALRKIVVGKNLASHWDLFTEVLQKEGPGVAYVLDRLVTPDRRFDWGEWETLLTEWEWMQSFVKRGDFEKLRAFLADHGDRKEARLMVQQLLRLEKEGALKRAFDLLSYVDDSNLRVVSKILTDGSESGELLAALRLMEKGLETVGAP